MSRQCPGISHDTQIDLLLLSMVSTALYEGMDLSHTWLRFEVSSMIQVARSHARIRRISISAPRPVFSTVAKDGVHFRLFTVEQSLRRFGL